MHEPRLILDPGRELDAQVAIEIFGWRWFRHIDRGLCALYPPETEEWVRWNWYPERYIEVDNPGEKYGDWDRCGGKSETTNRGVIGYLPRYSTDIAAAFDVVDHIENKGFWSRVQGAFEPGGKCSTGFTEHNFTGWNGRMDHRAIGKTKPHAICLAALEWARNIKKDVITSADTK